jgi:hypothetical protein
MCLHYTKEACVAHRRVYTSKAYAAPGRVYTTEECAASGRVYIIVSNAAPKVSTLQRPVLAEWALKICLRMLSMG